MCIGEAALGPDHPDLVASLGSLGNLLRDQGDLAAARGHYERALRISAGALGEDHSSTASVRANLNALPG